MRFVLINQTFYPDVMATGQYLADVAQALVERGHQVTVVTGRRAYDQPERVFPKEETWRGVRVVRVSSTGFGKAAKWRRAADFGSFFALCVLKLLFLPRHDIVLALTSPPLISVLGAFVSRLRGSRFVYWVMDFNPDEALAAGWLRADSFVGRLLEGLSRFSLRQAAKVIVLDRFMRERIVRKGIAPEKVAVLAPWAQDRQVRFDVRGRERFRKAHGLEGKFVVMYSGNHSPCHSLKTVLEAAKRLARDREVVFCFVGGGSEWRKICAAERTAKDGHESTRMEPELGAEKITNESRAKQPFRRSGAIPPSLHPSPPPLSCRSNILCLPYQPWSELAGSLSAADLHVVVMGDRFVGLVHSCKVYNILAVGSPLLYIGPAPSHVTEIFALTGGETVRTGVPPVSIPAPHHSSPFPFAFARHGEVDGVVEIIRRARAEWGSLERGVWNGLAGKYSREKVLPEFVALLESVQTASLRTGDGDEHPPILRGARQRAPTGEGRAAECASYRGFW